MKIIPSDVLDNNSILLDEFYFITVKDPKHRDVLFHYTSWCKDPLIKTILDLEYKHISIINNLIEKFSEKFNKKKTEFKVFVHFPPDFWRLHIHFVDINYKISGETKTDEIFDIYEILNNLEKHENYYRDKVQINSAEKV